MITHLEPDILECEVKWDLESITMNKVDVMEFQPQITPQQDSIPEDIRDLIGYRFIFSRLWLDLVIH